MTTEPNPSGKTLKAAHEARDWVKRAVDVLAGDASWGDVSPERRAAAALAITVAVAHLAAGDFEVAARRARNAVGILAGDDLQPWPLVSGDSSGEL